MLQFDTQIKIEGLDEGHIQRRKRNVRDTIFVFEKIPQMTQKILILKICGFLPIDSYALGEPLVMSLEIMHQGFLTGCHALHGTLNMAGSNIVPYCR